MFKYGVIPLYYMEGVGRLRQTLEASSLFIVLGPQEGGKTALLKPIAGMLGDRAVTVALKEKQNEWANLGLPPFRPRFKAEDLVEFGLSGVRHLDTSRGGHNPQWRLIACRLLSDWGFKVPICENSDVVESGIMTWARAEFGKLKEYIEPNPDISKGGLATIETYIDLIAITISRLAGYVDARYLIIDDVVAQLGRFKVASWALLHRNWFKIVLGQQVYQPRDISELRELTSASDALCLTPLSISGRVRWKPWHLLVLRDLRIPIKPKSGSYACIDDYGRYEIPFHRLVKQVP